MYIESPLFKSHTAIKKYISSPSDIQMNVLSEAAIGISLIDTHNESDKLSIEDYIKYLVLQLDKKNISLVDIKLASSEELLNAIYTNTTITTGKKIF